MHPAVVEAYLAGSLSVLEAAREAVEGLAQDARPPEAVDEAQSPTGHEQAGAQGLSDEETAVLALLRQSAAALAA